MTRTFVVTGSASGIGAATPALLTERGYRVIGVDLTNADVEADLSTHDGRGSAAKQAVDMAGGTVDAVVASSMATLQPVSVAPSTVLTPNDHPTAGNR